VLRGIVFDLWGTLMSERRDLMQERQRLRFERVSPILERYGIRTDLEEFTRLHLTSNRTLARAQEHGRDVSPEERARHVVYQFAPGAADRLTPEDAAAFADAYGGVAILTPPALLEGAREAVEEAARRGLRVGLLSNTGIAGGRHLRPVLARYGLLDRFDALLFSDEHGISKPNPRFFDLALERLEARPEEVVFVGDTPRYDVAPPRRLGWWVVQVGDRGESDPPPHARVPGAGEVFGALDALVESGAARLPSARP
jgi:FMN phosphatase YigB (HAD superfamily)